MIAAAKSAPNPLNDLARPDLQGVNHVNELDYIQPALATLVFADERLRPAQLPRQLGLRKFGVAPGVNQYLAKPIVSRSKDRSAHARRR